MSRTRIPLVPPQGRLMRANLALALASLFALGFVYLETLMEAWLGVESPLVSLLADPPWRYGLRAALLWALPAGMIYWLIGRLGPARWMRFAPLVHAAFLVAHLALAMYVVSVTANAMGAGLSFGLLRVIAGTWQMALAVGCLGLALAVWQGARSVDESSVAGQP